MVTIVTQDQLSAFRRDHLSPGAMLQVVSQHVAVLFRIGIGVGKSHAVDELLRSSELFDRFDLVIYIAPTWNILRERPIVAGTESARVPHLVILPRPAKSCGPLSKQWSDLEKRGCAAHAKATLCAKCPHLTAPIDPCEWPDQLKDLDGVGLIFAPEQQFLINRSLVHQLLRKTNAQRPLIIVDEGRLFDAQFETQITHEELEQFERAVTHDYGRQRINSDLVEWTREYLREIRRGKLKSLDNDARLKLIGLNGKAEQIQAAGIERFGSAFKYIGYDLATLAWSVPTERWWSDDRVRFVARPYLLGHLLVLSAHLGAHYVGHRLGTTSIESPFDQHRFIHTGTKLFNLRNRGGAASYFLKNHRSILDTFAVAIARNIERGRTTVVVARKKSKPFCADYLTKRLAKWGFDVTFVIDGSVPSERAPTVIPFLHYGVLGINDYQEYESLYCLNSYYVSSRALERVVMECDRDLFQVQLDVHSGSDRKRRVRASNAQRSRASIEQLANHYLDRLELDPVIQVAGRVRFGTKPREVVLFQMADLRNELPGITDVATPTALRAALGLPDPREIDATVLATVARRRMADGELAQTVADELDISRSTLFRRIKAGESVKSPIGVYSYRCFDTPPSIDGGGS